MVASGCQVASPANRSRTAARTMPGFPFTGNVMGALTAGPVPALLLAGLACLGWRRTAAVFAAFVPLAFVGISLTNGYILLAGPRGDVTLYAYGLEALILLTAPSTAQGWRALRWRPTVLLAIATVTAGAGMNGGLWPLFHTGLPNPPRGLARRVWALDHIPHGFLARLLGVAPGQWGDWLLFQGTPVAVIAVALTIMLVSSPVNRRVLALFAVPFALGAVIYVFSLFSPPLPASVGNTLAVFPLLLILTAGLVLSLGHRTGPDVPGRPAAPG
jgi:hypothetical protein